MPINSSITMRNWKSLFMFKHCCCSPVSTAIFLSLIYLVTRRWQMAWLDGDLGSQNHWLWSVSREVKIWSETSSMNGHISTSSSHHILYITAITWYFTNLPTVTSAGRSPCTSHSSFYSWLCNKEWGGIGNHIIMCFKGKRSKGVK